MANPIVDRAKVKLEAILRESVDGPEKLVADAILSGPERVRTLATNGGLVSRQIRQVAWPFLLSDRIYSEEDRTIKRGQTDEIETFKQIHLDVPRSVPAESHKFVETFLVEFFTKHQDLCFFQGFADIAWVVLQVMVDNEDDQTGVALAHFVLGRLSRDFYFRDAHRETFDAIYSYIDAIKAVIDKSDKDLSLLWEKTQSNHFWAISPLVCLFAHDVSDLSFSSRLLDVLIAQERNVDMPIFLVSSVALLPTVRSNLLALEGADSASIHETMIDSIRSLRNADELIEKAVFLRERIPPRFVIKAALAKGLPESSCLARSGPTKSPVLSKKRSWRTYTFFSTPNVEVDSR
jgi:Rab-GTPase-TBC domain